MNCEQKSGVFLNISCINKPEETCTNCGKKVCKVHVYKVEAIKSNPKIYCEDCYWENYFYTIEERKHNNVEEVFIETNRTPTVFNNSSSETNTRSGFEDGFGGGSFGGGGAGGSWTEGEMHSLTDDTDNNLGGLLTNDDTFFYS